MVEWLKKPARPLPARGEYADGYCEKCKRITPFKLEPCKYWYCLKCHTIQNGNSLGKLYYD